MSETDSRGVSIKRVVVTSFVVDLLDVFTNLAVTFLSGSVVMLSQALEGGADLISSGLLVIGHKRSAKEADVAHPFGHGREMYFWAMLSALVMLGVTATLSFYFGLQRFLHPSPLENIYLAYIVLTITIFTNGYALFLSVKRLMGRKNYLNIKEAFFHSPLIETKTTLILDLMGTLASILGLIALVLYFITGDLRYDGLGAMIIGIMIGVFSLLLLLSVFDLIIGKSASHLTKAQIRQAVLSIPEVKSILSLKTLHLGPENLMANIDVHLEDNLTTDQIEKIIEKVKFNVKEAVPSVSQIQIELNSPKL
ncbi:cation diffusion facilitator family transporter [Candidatus Daviesbacteria bacterium]|nr:cation diffusion facilitator family transporter [Candidatus Daviesbacteria bacterium]